MRSFLHALVRRLMRRSLHAAYRRVCWAGSPPDLPAGVPVVAYANHHHFFDGYLMDVVVDAILDRPGITWMEDWDRFPFFAAAGACPFPKDDPRRRAATLRHTVRRFRADPSTVLVYFPEGRLHAPEEGVLSLDTEALARLDRLLPEKLWWPVGIHATWWGEAQPTALLGGGTPHATADGRERDRLDALVRRLRATHPQEARVLLQGRRSPQETWNFAFSRRFFERFL